jgi:hypothetical protein
VALRNRRHLRRYDMAAKKGGKGKGKGSKRKASKRKAATRKPASTKSAKARAAKATRRKPAGPKATRRAAKAPPPPPGVRASMADYWTILEARGPNEVACNEIESNNGGDPRRSTPYPVASYTDRGSAEGLSDEFRAIKATARVEP